MPTREAQVRHDSRLFSELCAALLRRGHRVQFQVQGASMQPNLREGDTVVIAPASAGELHSGDVAFVETSNGLRVHRVKSALDSAVVTQGDTGLEPDPRASQIFGRAASFSRNGVVYPLHSWRTRVLHPVASFSRRLRLAAKNRLRSFSAFFGVAALFAFLATPGVHAQTADLQLTQTASSSAVDTNGITQSLGTASSATWTGGVVTFNFPAPLPSGVFTNALLTTAGFTPSYYNVSASSITSVNYVTGAVTVNLAAQTANATAATWANGVASFTFPTPLPAMAIVGGQMTTTGFTPAAYNVTNATITGVNTVTGVVTVALPSQSLGTATAATYAAGQLRITFPTPLPSYAVAGALVTTTGFAPAGYNVSNAVIASISGGNQIRITAANPGVTPATTLGAGTVGPGTSTANGTATFNPITPTTGNGTGTVPTGFTYSEVVTNKASSATVGSGTITAYMQTPANTVYESYFGTNWTCTTPAVGGTGPIICTYNNTLATGATATTLTLGFQIPSGTAYGTTIQSSATVTNSTAKDTVPSNNTSISSIVVEPSTASDLAVSMSVAPTPVFVASTFTYTINVQNLGQAAAPASSNVLSDTLPAGLTNVNVVAPAGWSCTGTATVTCSITSPMAANTTASITISATTPSSATTLTNTATVALAGDPNGSNNSASAYTVVQPIACATPGRDGAGGTLTGIVNAYYPPASAGTVASGATSITLGAASANGAQTPIASGDLLLVMQMQGATINATQSGSYGDGAAGDPASGSTSLGNSGLFEFVTATSAVPVAGGTLNFTGTGPTGGLLNSYSRIAATTSSVGTASAASWNANIASFTFTSPLPASIIVNSVLTTAGFLPTGYNVTNATILTVNNATGVITVSLATNPGAATTLGTGTVYSQGQRTFQVIRVPQYASATLGSGLLPLAWNGSVGGVLAIDVSSQLTLGGTVAADALGFRGGGTQLLTGPSIGGTNSPTDYVTFAPANNTTATGANAPKGEGVAGTPRYLAPAGITTASTPTDTTGGAPADSLPGGSFARGAPGNAGGGGTDGHPAANDDNSGGGAGSNGGAGGQGGYGWNSIASTNTTDGGFGGAIFPATTSTLAMGGGGGGGTTNNGTYCTNYNVGTGTCAGGSGNGNGIYSSGGAGGGIIIIHAGSVTGSGTITSNGQNTLSTLNDSTGGGGAGGSILVFVNSGTLSGLTVSANGGNAGYANPTAAPGGFPGERHGPGGGGGGGVIFLTASPFASSVTGGSNGFTNTVQDSYGATAGTPGIVATAHVITETPGTQSGGYCGSADISVTDAGSPSIVAPGGTITYTQTVSNNGPLDAVNGVFSEAIPANTTFASLSAPAGWTCTTPAVNGTGNISCTNPLVVKGGPYSFTLVVNVPNSTPSGTQIVDSINAVSGTTDPNLANNSATVTTTVGSATSADLQVTNAVPTTTIAGNDVTYTAVVTNNGPATTTALVFTELTASNSGATVNATFVSLVPPAGWSCSTPAPGSTGTIACSAASLGVGGTATFSVVMNVPVAAPAGTALSASANIISSTPDPNTGNNLATATTVVATAGQSDLAVTSSAVPNPVIQGNNITYTQAVTNNGPTAASAATFTDTIPTGTTLVSFTPPANWTCNTIPVGGSGTFTCTLNLGQTLAVGASVNFPMVVQVGLSTAPGTSITNTANINVPCSSATDPNCGNNSASTTVVVASPTQADVKIVKTAAPEPVTLNNNLTYTLVVSNGGPAIAQNVTVSDNIPSTTTYVSASTPQGSCSTTVISVATPYPSNLQLNCTLGSIGVGNQVVITVNVTATTFSSGSLTTNTATVSSTTSDPNSSNNTSTVNSTIQAATAVGLSSFNAYRQSNGAVLLEWHTHEESRNLGFHIYREDASGRHRVSNSLIVGSALLLRSSRPQHAAKTYRWIDTMPVPDAAYWIEDVDINGTRTLHGPANVQSAAAAPMAAQADVTLSPTAALAAVQPLSERTISSNPAHPSIRVFLPRPLPPPPPVNTPVFTVADHAAIKLGVDQEGWYSVPFSQLIAAGLDPNTDPRSLRLFAEGVEQPLLLTGQNTSSALEFYGTGIDTPFSGTRIYWLVREAGTPKRIATVPAPNSGTPAPSSFPFTVVREDRVSYFAALLNGENNDNFFGPIVTSDPVSQDLLVAHLDTASSLPITLDVALQGVTDQQAHRVAIQLNGASIGELDFYGMVPAVQTFSVEASLLTEGANTIALTALEGDFDVSVVKSVALHYPHTYTADSDWLRATAASGSSLEIAGFSNARIRAFDITDPLNIAELSGNITESSGSYQIALNLPQSSPAQRTILAFASDAVSSPVSIAQYTPAFLDDRRSGADIVMVSHPDFVASLAPLVRLRQSQGHHVELVTTDQLYDEYNFGERSPFAIRAFLQDAVSHWSRKPQSVLLVGDASFDPRDYLGFGPSDFTPTRIIETSAFKTASDDWFTDFQQTGYATLPTGRLPVRTAADADLVVSKIVNYEQRTYAGAWNSQAIFIADQNSDTNFSNAATAAAINLPAAVTPSRIFTDGLDTPTARSQVLNALNSGALLINYDGHGAEQQWSFSDIFDNNDAQALNNGGRLPVYLLMDCLNGFFQDVYAQSLSKSIILAPNGGGVAVWASSGFTEQAPQATMNQALLRQFQLYPTHSLGKLILDAKAGTTDNDVRRTWVLFGDPAMKLQLNASASPNNNSSSTQSVQPVLPAKPAPSPKCGVGKVCLQGGSQQ